ncbi:MULTISPECIES: outer membrane beta-barrel protein [Flammeovirga]|uniref:Porin family protein n=1 Tax=Flammeovirga agarivorans TaxID=2726742 RepID=A0A7X8XYN8_9BACT|nr:MULTISPECIES: outer membrane beta-barrel protein [Flammeovirga]NLR94399.1 porin family protein [Flammeovirga agarivorans]
MKKSLLLTLFALLCITASSQAQFYVGASGGNSFINHNLKSIEGDNFKVNDNTGSWKVYGGIGNRFLGLEGGYRSVGTVQGNEGGYAYDSNITGWDAALKGTIHIGPVFGFAKAGAFFGKYEDQITGGEMVSYKDTSFMWGVGAGVLLGKTFEIRMEWEALNLSSSQKISTLSLGTAIHLGGNKDKN